MLAVLAAVLAQAGFAQGAGEARVGGRESLPPRVVDAQRFLAERGWPKRRAGGGNQAIHPAVMAGLTQSPAPATWQPLGPTAVISANYGLVTGRVASIAFDPADPTGNRVYLGTTGGGVWLAQNGGTSNAASVVFTPLTDTVAALSTARDASISIGAITVQPGGTGVILAGTGDPNDALDSYYGAGILRSTDGGNSWNLIALTSDQLLAFTGEGFAGFAWSTSSPQLVVAAVSEAYEGTLTNAERPNVSYAGLYYSTDSGATWSLARITDQSGIDVQGPGDLFALPNGNAATSVVWNPVRRVFVAAVRYHGYYQSTDGMTWTRLTAQPGAGLTAQMCPANPGSIGSVACPIFRGTLAVNPLTGDTFAWTVNANNQDQGIWQDPCAVSAGTCTNQNISFLTQLNTSALETNTAQGAMTVENGDYNLALTAMPSGQDTLLFAGGNDLWKCSLAMNCVWRNTTNANTCMSAQVAGYQHALAWNPANPLEIFLGNDSGLWRSADGVGETGPVCSASDASHFQNLNGGLGSLAEVVSMSAVSTSPYTMMTGLGANGTAGVKGTTGPTVDWPEILSGEGGPVAVDPSNNSNWYVNNQVGVSIHLCAETGECTPSDFGSTPVVNDADVNRDGDTMTTPAPFIVDPLDSSQLLVGTCRVWRGPGDGSGWSGGNAVSPILDGVSGNPYCSGDALIRTLTALPLAGGGEVIYVGMYGAANGGGILAGHVLRATFNPGNSTMPVWTDLSHNPVTNDTMGINAYGLDISSTYIDPHDATGNTVYVTVDGVPSPTEPVRVAYRSTDGGAHWAYITSNLGLSPANSLVVDPQDANTAYIATDAGVFSTRKIATCGMAATSCWSAFGTGLPEAPVVELSATPATTSPTVLAAATYGRGVWQIPLWTAGTQLSTATVDPSTLTFPPQVIGDPSSAQTVTLTNTGGIALTPTVITVSGDFNETDTCLNATVNTGASCSIQVAFTPTQAGGRTGQLNISANMAGGAIAVALSGTGESSGAVQLAPATLSFGQVETGTSSTALQVTLENGASTALPITSATVTAPFVLASNACGTSLAANSDCQLMVEFAPSQTGAATGTLTLVDGGGTQTVQLTGTGAAPPTDTLSSASLTFPATVIGAISAAQVVTLTNNGDVPLTGITSAASGPFQVTGNCGGQLAGDSSCSLSVAFVPTDAGSQTGTLSVVDSMKTQTVALSGTGILAPLLSVSPNGLSFPAQQVGAASSPLIVTVSDTGGSPMANVGFAFTGQGAGSFSAGATTCGVVLNNGGSCTVQVIFTPAATGANAATLTVTSSTLGVKAVTVALSGAGVAASGLNVSPAEMTFNEATLGHASAAQTGTISNTSSVNATGLTLAVTAPFSLTQNTCVTTLAAGASCTVGLVFTPTGNGSVAGSLTVGSATLNTGTIALSGTGGSAGSVQLQPAELTFATTGVGASSNAQTVTVTNSSAAVPLTNLAVTISNGFQIANNTCPGTLAPGVSCTVGVMFTPASAGQQTGNLTVASSALAASTQAPLSGMGLDFTAALGGSSGQSVASGQTANYTLVLTPASGSSGMFTFKCGTLPAYSTCTFNPASETVPASSTGNVTVSVATGQALTASASRSPGWGVYSLACGLMLVPLAWGRRRKVFLLVPLGLLVISGMSSCSGAGGGAGGGPHGGSGTNTPPGTYSIPVSVTSCGASHTVMLTLTVD
jgi:hypothetical protein